jgi:hypothetical protein
MQAKPIPRRAFVALAALLVAATPLGFASAPEAAAAPAGVLEGLLELAGVEGDAGLDLAALDARLAGAASPVPAVADAKALLAALEAAEQPAEVFAAAVSAGMPAPVGKAASPAPLAASVLGLYAQLGVVPTPMQVAQVQEAAAKVPAGQATGISMLVEAVRGAQVATNNPSPSAAVQATADLLATITAAAPSLQAGASTMAACPAPPIFADPLNLIMVRGTCNDTDSVHHMLQVDLGGNEVYTNRAGGAQQSNSLVPANVNDQTIVSVSIDLGSGADQYTDTAVHAQGAGVSGGIGILYDDGGNDAYQAFMASQGLGAAGVGVLYDAGGADTYNGGRRTQASGDLGFLLDRGNGDDQYTATHGSQGARFAPLLPGLPSVLYDAGGNDVYTGTGISQGAGNYLVDARGDDSYTANGGALSIVDGYAQGAGVGTERGMLIDGAGNDRYTSNIYGSQGFTPGQSLGALVDLSGNDVYQAAQRGQGWCRTITGGQGAILFDGDGDDSYTTFEGQGASRSTCVGALVDADGNDSYTAGDHSQGAAFTLAPEAQVQPLLGALIDGGGHDRYHGGASSQGSGASVAGVGLLLDADGTDRYEAGADSQGSGTGSTGILVDGLQDAVSIEADHQVDPGHIEVEGTLVSPGDQHPGGPGTHADQYTAGDRSQGSGSSGGIGMLLDNDDEATGNGPNAVSFFTAGATSQGASQAGGLGALFNREGRDAYSARDGSQGSSVDGNVAVLFDRSGRDSYTVTNPAVSRGYGQSTADHLSFGLMLDGSDPKDVYSGFPGTSHNNVCEEKGDAGLTIDTELPQLPPGCATAIGNAANALAAAAGAFANGLVTEVIDTVTNLVVPPSGPAGPCTGAAGEYFCDDVESGGTGWTVLNGLNEWRVVDQSVTPSGSGVNAASGGHYWYVGASGAPGVTYLGNEDLATGGVTIESASFSVAGAVAPRLTYAVSGGSEAGFDFLQVYVVSGTTATMVDQLSGQAVGYQTRNVSLPAGVGPTVSVRFLFVTDLIVEDGPGWNVDDIRVAEP